MSMSLEFNGGKPRDTHRKWPAFRDVLCYREGYQVLGQENADVVPFLVRWFTMPNMYTAVTKQDAIHAARSGYTEELVTA